MVYRFLKDDVCSYVIKNPTTMGPKDWMWLYVTKAENAEVHVSTMYDFRYDGRPTSWVGFNGKKYGMLRGKDFYVTGIAMSVFPGFFRMETWINPYIPPVVEKVYVPPPVPPFE